MRAYRSTRPRLAASPVHNTNGMRLIRRVSAAFKDVPGGQHLGPTRDYSQRLMRFELADENKAAFSETAKSWMDRLGVDDAEVATDFPRVVEHLRSQGLLPPSMNPMKNPWILPGNPWSSRCHAPGF